MTLPEIIAEHIKPESKEQGIITRRKIAFVDSRCRYEYEVTFGPDKSTPQYRHVYVAELQDFDPRRIEFRQSSSGPVLILWTQFLRNVVQFEAWYPDRGCVKSYQTDQLWIPLKKALSPEQKRELKRLAEGFMVGGVSHEVCADDLKRNLDEIDLEIQDITSNVDFDLHGGVGVIEQQIALSSNRTSLIFSQFRKALVESDGSRLTAKIPLWTIKEEMSVLKSSEETRGFLPNVVIGARHDRMPFKFDFIGAQSFTSKVTHEYIYSQTGEKCDRLKTILVSAIKTAKDLEYLNQSELGVGRNPLKRARPL